MTLGLGITLGAILGLLLASAFFSGSETALTAASAAKMHALEQEGNRRARVVNYLLSMRERFIGAILLGNTLANVAASALATSLFLTLFGEEGVVYATIVMTVIVVLFAEVLPKTYAILMPTAWRCRRAGRAFRRGGAGAGDGHHAVDRPPHLAPVRRLDQRRRRGALRARGDQGRHRAASQGRRRGEARPATCWAACSICAS